MPVIDMTGEISPRRFSESQDAKTSKPSTTRNSNPGPRTKRYGPRARADLGPPRPQTKTAVAHASIKRARRPL
jgi:hypothetical protein